MGSWLLTAGDFTPLGGMDRANHALARALAERGADVELVTHRVWPDLAAPNIRVTLVPRPMDSHLAGAPLLAAAARRAARRLSDARVVANGGNTTTRDITWIHYLHAAYAAASGAPLRAGRRVAFTYYLRRERAALRAAKYIVCNSARTASDVARFYGIDDERLRIVYYGSDVELFSPVSEGMRREARRALGWDERVPVAVFVGALGDRRKGFDRLLDAWEIVSRDTGWDMELVVAGSGVELPSWRARAERGRLRIRFLGFRPDIQRVIAASDVMVHPARYEAYGLGVHEALCRAVPAIVSAGAGVAERYPAELRELLLEDPESPAEIAARLHRWRSRRDHYERVTARLSARLRERSWDDMAVDFLRAVDAEP